MRALSVASSNFAAAALATAAGLAVYLALTAGAATWDEQGLRAVKVLLLAPIVEEVLFRGGLHAALRRRHDLWGRPGVAIAVTALAFGVAHLAAAPWTHALAVVVPAWVIGVVFERTRSIAVCVAMHMAFNATWWIVSQ